MEPSIPNLSVDLLSAVSMPRLKEELPHRTPQPPAPAKKKRVRRQKLELDYLRELVGNLELQMATLQTSRLSSSATEEEATSKAAPSIWKGIAERQEKERARAEEKNQKLRTSLEGQLKLATKLEKLLRKRPREEEVAALAGCKHFKSLENTNVKPTDDEIFADQLAHVQRAHLEAEQMVGGPEFADQAATFCDLHVMNDPSSETGVAFVTKASSMLPFDVHVTEKAFWRAFAVEGPRKMSYFIDERTSMENLVALSYGLNFHAGSFSTNVRGKQTYRKYVSDDCVTIMWKSHTEPIEIDGTKLSGLTCTQTGWVVLRGVNIPNTREDAMPGCIETSSVMMSTSLQSYCKMTLELQDDIADQDFQVGTITDFVVNSHDTIAEVCGKLINEVLVEEDWNINGWLNNLVL